MGIKGAVTEQMRLQQEFDKDHEKITAKTRIPHRTYKFKGAISEVFEPYLKSYSDSE